MMKMIPKYGRYYDLIRVPHGHIPAPKANLWSGLPIPVKEIRGPDFYACPECGNPSFFKINYVCYECEDNFQYCDPKWEDRAYVRFKRRMRRRYFKDILKRIECWLLPVLVLTGKAWYVVSNRWSQKEVFINKPFDYLEFRGCLECGEFISVPRFEPYKGQMKPTGLWLTSMDEEQSIHTIGALCSKCADTLYEKEIIGFACGGGLNPEAFLHNEKWQPKFRKNLLIRNYEG